MRPAPVVAAALLLSALAGTAAAQTPFVPYYGKNNIHYDTFQWFIYTTDHFEIYYYPEIEQHLERVASYAESAYQQVSADLHHDLSFKVQMILFKTHSEFEQQNVIPGAAQEGVGAFAEPFRQRMVLPIDDPPDRLYGLDRPRAHAPVRVRHDSAVADPPDACRCGSTRASPTTSAARGRRST